MGDGLESSLDWTIPEPGCGQSSHTSLVKHPGSFPGNFLPLRGCSLPIYKMRGLMRMCISSRSQWPPTLYTTLWGPCAAPSRSLRAAGSTALYPASPRLPGGHRKWWLPWGQCWRVGWTQMWGSRAERWPSPEGGSCFLLWGSSPPLSRSLKLFDVHSLLSATQQAASWLSLDCSALT